MAGITTAFPTSAKAEYFQAAHCFNATVTPTASGTSGQFTLTSMSSNAGVAVGMSASGTNVASGAVVASIDSSTQITLSKAHTGTVGPTATITISGDTFKMALFKSGVAGTYGAATVNYTDMTGNSDETSGTGYSATGTALTNVTAVTSGTTGYINFSPNPSWTSSSFSTDGCMIYNTNARLGGTSGTNTQGAGRCVGVFSFGSTVTVSSGTLTVLMPAAAAGTAVIRIG
jgi:hypothetical protein